MTENLTYVEQPAEGGTPAPDAPERESFRDVVMRAWAQPWGKVVAFVLVFALGFGVGFPSGMEYLKWQIRQAFTQALGGSDTSVTEPFPYDPPASVPPTQEAPGYIDPTSTHTPETAMGMEGADYPKGTEGSFGTLTMRVGDVDCSQETWKADKSSQYGNTATATTDKQLCVIPTQIMNKTNYPQSVDFEAMLVDTKGNWYSYDNSSHYDESRYSKLDPAESTKYDIVFVIPDGQLPNLLNVSAGYGEAPFMYALS